MQAPPVRGSELRHPAGSEEETTEESVPQDLLPLLAEYLQVDPEKIKGFVAAIEYEPDGEEGLSLKVAWMRGMPIWRLFALTDELRYHFKQYR